MFKDFVILIKNYFQDKEVATIASTSPFSIEKILKHFDFSKDMTVIEYGPGTGPITKALLSRMTPGSKLFAIERNEALYQSLQNIKDSRLTLIHDDVKYIEKLARDNHIDKADYVISGIPFSFLKEEDRERIIHQSHVLLKENGACILYQFSSLMKKYLDEIFLTVIKEMMPLNVPPLVLLIARK